MSPPPKSNIWKFFEVNKCDHDKADCKICNKSYSRRTNSLRNHLKLMHPKEYSTYQSMNKQLPNTKSAEDPPLQKARKREERTPKEKNLDINNFNSKKIDILIGEMIALQNLPFNFVEGLGFRRLIEELAPRYNFREPNFFTDFVCKDLYGKVAQKVTELIEKFDYMSFTSNIWSDPSSDASLLSLTCHGIAKNFGRSSILLKCETFESRPTGDVISEKFNTMLYEWNIKKEQVHCLIRDEGSYTKGAMRLSALIDIDCTVDKLQLAISSCLGSQDNIKRVTNKCETCSIHFKASTIAQEKLQTIQNELNQPHLKVFQDCVTRWNSTFYMFERFSKVKDALSLYLNNNVFCRILPEEWEIIESFIELLRPFEEATRELSSSHTLISSVIPIIQMLKKNVDDYLTRSQEFDPIRQAVTTLKNELSTKFFNLGKNNVFIIATYLDPRYKQKFFIHGSEEEIEYNILTLTNTNNYVFGSLNADSQGAKRMSMTDSTEKDMGLIGPGISSIVRKPCLKNDLAMMLDSSSEYESQGESEDASFQAVLEKELLSYRTKKRANVDENPLQWWNAHREEFKMLSPIARRFLSAPPGSVPSEQLFSSMGLISEPLRDRLKSENAAILLFIKYNAPIFNFTY